MLSVVILQNLQHMTRVDFSFAIGEAQYRVERLPKQLVAKKRGTGMREQNASATVYEMKDGEWKVIATSAAAIRDTSSTHYRLS